MDSAIMDHLTTVEKDVDSEVTKPKRGRKKRTDNKTLPTINEAQENDVREKKDWLQLSYLVTQKCT